MRLWKSVTASRVAEDQSNLEILAAGESWCQGAAWDCWHAGVKDFKSRGSMCCQKMAQVSRFIASGSERLLGTKLQSWCILARQSSDRRANTLKASTRGYRFEQRDILHKWSNHHVMSSGLRRSRRMIHRRQASSLARRTIASWRVIIAWASNLKLVLTSILSNQDVRLLRRVWLAMRIHQVEHKQTVQRFVAMVALRSALSMFQAKGMGKKTAMQKSVCRRFCTHRLQRRCGSVFLIWRQLLADCNDDVVTSVGVVFVVKKARHFLKEWRRELHRRQAQKWMSGVTVKVKLLKQRRRLSLLLALWCNCCRCKKRLGRVRGILANRRDVKWQQRALKALRNVVSMRLRRKRIAMQISIRSAGLTMQRALREWESSRNDLGNLVQMQSLLSHKCGMDLERRTFQVWYSQKEVILRSMHSAWWALAVGASLAASSSNCVSSRRRSCAATVAAFIVKRKGAHSAKVRMLLFRLLAAWRTLTMDRDVHSRVIRVLSCEPVQLQIFRMHACLSMWRCALNCRILLNAPLHLLRRSHDAKLAASALHSWGALTGYFRTLQFIFLRIWHQTRGRHMRASVRAWADCSLSCRLNRLKIKRGELNSMPTLPCLALQTLTLVRALAGAEKCVKTMWASMRVVWVHWIKVILARRCLVHTYSLARWGSVSRRTRRCFVLWHRSITTRPPKELQLSSSRLLEGDSAQGYDVWQDESSETDIDEDDGGETGRHVNPRDDDSSDQDHQKKQHNDSQEASEPTSPQPKPVIISGIDKMPSFPGVDAGYSRSHSRVNVPVREVIFFEGQSSQDKPASAFEAPKVRFRTLPRLPSPKDSSLAIPRFATWLSQEQRLSAVQATFAKRSNARAISTVFWVWASLVAAHLAAHCAFESKLFLSRQRIFGGYVEDMRAAAPGLQHKILTRCKAEIFEFWSCQVTFATTARIKIKRALERCTQHLLKLATRIWIRHYLRMHVLRTSVCRTENKCRRHQLERALDAWICRVDSCTTSLREAAKAWTRRGLCLVSMALRAWKLLRQIQHVLDNARMLHSQRVQQRLLLDAVLRWQEWLESRKVLMDCCQAIIKRRYRACFFLVWRSFQGVDEVAGHYKTVAVSRIVRFARSLRMKRSLSSWHRHVQNGGEARHSVQLAHYRRARAMFQDIRHFMVRNSLLAFLSQHLARISRRRSLSRAMCQWRTQLELRQQGPYLVKERISEVYLSLSPFPRTYRDSPSMPRI